MSLSRFSSSPVKTPNTSAFHLLSPAPSSLLDRTHVCGSFDSPATRYRLASGTFSSVSRCSSDGSFERRWRSGDEPELGKVADETGGASVVGRCGALEAEGRGEAEREGAGRRGERCGLGGAGPFEVTERKEARLSARRGEGGSGVSAARPGGAL